MVPRKVLSRSAALPVGQLWPRGPRHASKDECCSGPWPPSASTSGLGTKHWVTPETKRQAGPRTGAHGAGNPSPTQAPVEALAGPTWALGEGSVTGIHSYFFSHGVCTVSPSDSPGGGVLRQMGTPRPVKAEPKSSASWTLPGSRWSCQLSLQEDVGYRMIPRPPGPTCNSGYGGTKRPTLVLPELRVGWEGLD